MDPLVLHGEPLLKALAEIVAEVVSARSVGAVLSCAGKKLQAIGIQMVMVQYEDALARLRYPFVPAEGAPLPPLPGLDDAFRTGQPFFVDDIGGWVRALVPAGAATAAGRVEKMGRAIVAPLRVHEWRWGVLVLASSALEPSDLPALQLFAAQLLAALQTAQTIEALEERNNELEAVHAIISEGTTEMNSGRLLKTVAEATSSDMAGLHRFDSQSGDYVLVGDVYGYRGPLTERWQRIKPEAAALLRVSISRPTTDVPSSAALLAEGFHQFATVILTVGGKRTGFLSLARRKNEPYSPAELRIAEILGGQVSSLLERALLNAESNRLLRQLHLLYAMTSAGAVVGQVNPVIERLLSQMLDAFPVDAAAIHFIERTQLHLAGYTVHERMTPGGPPTPEFMPIDDTSLLGRCVLSRKTLSMAFSDLPTLSQQVAGRLRVKELFATPLVVGDRLVGTLSLARLADAPFSASESKLAESCAAHIAVILEQVRLYADLKQSYDELAHTQAELVKHEQLAAVVAHEVRNPLGVVFNSLTALKRLLKPTGDAEMLLRIIGEEADRLNRIVADLLDFARPYEALKKPIALEPILSSAVEAAIAAMPSPAAQVVVEVPEELPHFQVDEHLVRRALVNLVVNALQAMPRGGTVTLRAISEEREGQIWVRLEVRDEGVGISPESAEQIFQPFFTTKATGTGLGLAVVKRIVDAHHGEVTVQARPEGGTTFTVRLPGGTARPKSAYDDDEDEDTVPSSAQREPAAHR
jgi:two-component system sensor histidine kinase HydH